MAHECPTDADCVLHPSNWFEKEVGRAARDGHQKMMRPEGFGLEFYLYFRPGLLVIAESKPPGCALSTPERVPGNLTVEQLTGWVHRNSTRLGCLPRE